MNFFKRKRNIYFSIIIMLTVVMGLFSISFSYYVDESSKTGLFKINEIDNRLQSDSLTNGTITVNAQETVEFSIYVISNNNFETKYELYYQTNNESNLEVYTVNNIKETIPSHSVYEYKIVIENYNETSVDVTLGIASSDMQGEVKSPGVVIEKREI